MANGTSENSGGFWPDLGRELWGRLKDPWSHPTFLMFFVVAILGLGPIGTWQELYDYMMTPHATLAQVRASVISFVPAFVAATAMQLILAEGKLMRSFALFMLALCAVTLGFCNSARIADFPALAWGGVSIVTALLMWWVANANTRDILDFPSEDLNAVGGALDPNRRLPGSLNGFETE